MLDKEIEESNLNSSKTEEYLDAKINKLENAMSDQKKIREESEEHIV